MKRIQLAYGGSCEEENGLSYLENYETLSPYQKLCVPSSQTSLK
jgi:hypothetical protein